MGSKRNKLTTQMFACKRPNASETGHQSPRKTQPKLTKIIRTIKRHLPKKARSDFEVGWRELETQKSPWHCQCEKCRNRPQFGKEKTTAYTTNEPLTRNTWLDIFGDINDKSSSRRDNFLSDGDTASEDNAIDCDNFVDDVDDATPVNYRELHVDEDDSVDDGFDDDCDTDDLNTAFDAHFNPAACDDVDDVGARPNDDADGRYSHRVRRKTDRLSPETSALFSPRLSEFLGCMSFGVKGIAQATKEVNGWYYLLTEDVGKRKHLVASTKPRASLKMRGHNNIPVINKDVIGLEPVTVTLTRGKNGFGFSVVDEFPVKVGRVDLASPAESAGLKQGDYIIKVNNQNVSRSTVVSVAKLVKKSGSTLLLHVQRPRQMVEEPVDNAAWKKPEPVYESIAEEPTPYAPVPEQLTIFDYEKENEMSVDHDITAPFTPFPVGQLPTSTPLPLMQVGQKSMPSMNAEQKKQEAVHRLLSLELDFIDFMHAGIQRYSRPLRHCILSVAQHSAVFQNVEKLVTISEYHVKQMQENTSSMCSESEDDSQSSEDRTFTTSIALIYHSKVHMFCQAHETYALGLSEANRVLSELRQNEDFVRFVKEPALEAGQPSISAFIFRPLQHIKELYLVLQDIYTYTPTTSPDHATLRQVTQVLNESISSISNMSNARVQSLTSLTSHTKTSSIHGSSSGKGSSASSSSTSSASSTSSRDSCHTGSHHDHKTTPAPSMPQSASMQTLRTVDREVMRLQDRLVFDENIHVFQLCQEDRRIIYQDEVFHWHGRQWTKVVLVLLSDMVLVLRGDKDGSLHVISAPLLLNDICGIEMDRKHGTEFLLHTCPTSPCTGIPASQKLLFRTPTIEDKATWRRLFEQRVTGTHSEISSAGVVI